MSTTNFTNISVSGAVNATTVVADSVVANSMSLLTTDLGLSGTLKASSITPYTSGTTMTLTAPSTITLDTPTQIASGNITCYGNLTVNGNVLSNVNVYQKRIMLQEPILNNNQIVASVNTKGDLTMSQISFISANTPKTTPANIDGGDVMIQSIGGDATGYTWEWRGHCKILCTNFTAGIGLGNATFSFNNITASNANVVCRSLSTPNVTATTLISNGTLDVTGNSTMGNITASYANINSVFIGSSSSYTPQSGIALAISQNTSFDNTVNGAISGNVYPQLSFGAGREHQFAVDAVDNTVSYFGITAGGVPDSDYMITYKRGVGMKISPACTNENFTEALRVVGTSNITGDALFGSNLTVSGATTNVTTLNFTDIKNTNVRIGEAWGGIFLGTPTIANNQYVPFQVPQVGTLDGQDTTNRWLRVNKNGQSLTVGVKLTFTFEINSGFTNTTTGAFQVQTSTTSAFTVANSRSLTRVLGTFVSGQVVERTLDFILPTTEEYFRVIYNGNATWSFIGGSANAFLSRYSVRTYL